MTFGLKDTSLTLNEEGGATARVCVIVTTGTLGRDVLVTLNTMDGTATCKNCINSYPGYTCM